ncbi:hypothetical protein A3D80_01000 [Candidatus Roizmanbacteria bacterium RIFCSPHIGHO2_02_FULL_40_13b]|uniref:Glycosyltransferase RgtA/B/C/D-like domain-containing protein n=1 Tax=Candidatus Roizmanbacteria bacterium RIFCSPHIGHO2_01_FULL_39_24 TaxID=1802032 RepID=A0A1F7GJ87_9BACT|nr:MAG: hypothetical protein A2799_02365 [Candidatus Roizmanbacteria bacterium RIFCSPHIGHO2_01_FULL_39_24]OGK26273.1 MAG: hypothetical protein A3D80_01000 [Candidatus Roizmanbacteria bacterium RIFCSPHIGHO2_02_FULL_40_13b]OGK48908.1 MAG: hypothetical protein A3A56_01760 [Candidatus Roizmanbacteria bacterium RIFCSPLOWO2_01_FULL_40_32]
MTKYLRIVFFFLVSLYLLSSIINLQGSYLYDWDEAIYAQVGREMVANKTIFGVWNGAPWLEKPPLVPLISGLFMKFPLGSTEFLARLPSFLAGLGVLYLLFKILKEKFKKEYLKYFTITTTFLLLSAPFMNRMTSLNTDIFLVFGWLGFYYYYKKSFVASTLFLFIAVMSKSFLGFFPILVILIESVILERSDRISTVILNRRLAVKDLGVAVLISLTWFFLAFLRFGNLFLQENLYDHLVARVVKPVELHYGGYLFYPKLLFSYYNIFLILIIISIAYILYSLVERKRKELLFIPLFLMYGAIISLAKTKLNWYIFPILPFLGLSFSILIMDFLKKFKIKDTVLWLVLSVIFFVGVFVSGGFTLRLHKEKPTDLVSLALYAKTKCRSTAIVANNDEQKFFDVINAANVQISSTFRYGGSPSFRFYADQLVLYKYDKTPNRDIVDHTDCVIIPLDSHFLFKSKDWEVSTQKDGFVLYKQIN